jgi:hypothetical protein
MEERCCLGHIGLCTLMMVVWGDRDRGAQEHFFLVLGIATITLQAVGSARAHVLVAPIVGS